MNNLLLLLLLLVVLVVLELTVSTATDYACAAAAVCAGAAAIALTLLPAGDKPPVSKVHHPCSPSCFRLVDVVVLNQAQALCISVTTLKRLCRRHGVKRWPHRQLSGLNRAVSHLEAKQEASGDPVIADQLRQLYSRRDVVIEVRAVSGGIYLSLIHI